MAWRKAVCTMQLAITDCVKNYLNMTAEFIIYVPTLWRNQAESIHEFISIITTVCPTSFYYIWSVTADPAKYKSNIQSITDWFASHKHFLFPSQKHGRIMNRKPPSHSMFFKGSKKNISVLCTVSTLYYSNHKVRFSDLLKQIM